MSTETCVQPAMCNVNGEGEDAIPENKAESVYERAEDDWEHDPRNPRNWSSGKKHVMAGIVSFHTFVTPLSSTMMAPALPEISTFYDVTSGTIQAMTLSIFLLSYAIGPLILSPLSEMYGRAWVLDISMIFFTFFNVGCAYAPTTGALIALRLLAGFAGSAPIGIGGSCISDMYSERERAGAMALYNLGPLLGAAIGPVVGGFVTEAVGWQWIFKVMAILSGVTCVVSIAWLREMYGPVLRLRIAAVSADPEAAAAAHPHFQAAHGSKARVLWVNLSRPFVMLAKSLVCQMLSLFMGFNYGVYYLMATIFPSLLKDIYGWGPGIAGLAYIGMGVGFAIASIIGGMAGDVIYRNASRKNGGKGTPEMRLPMLLIGSLFLPVGLLWYGWSAQAKLHFMMPIVGSAIFAFGLTSIMLPIQLYLVDSFNFAASALAAASVVRSTCGFIFPLFAKQMFDKLGDGPGNTLLAALSVILGVPFPLFLYFYGERIRNMSEFTRASAAAAKQG